MPTETTEAGNFLILATTEWDKVKEFLDHKKHGQVAISYDEVDKCWTVAYIVPSYQRP